MTRMLASVTGPPEADIALAGGADIIDLKDPAKGALGAVDLPVLRETVARVGHRRAVSAVTGDLPMQPERLLRAAEEIAGAGADIVKLGVFPGGDAAACIRALAPLAARVRLVAVLFADRAPDLGLLPLLKDAGFTGAMLDTADKSGGSLLAHMHLPALRSFVAKCRAAGLEPGLAGSLEPPDVVRLLVLGPAVLGFRGALCSRGNRTGQIDAAAVQVIRALIPAEHDETAASSVDLRLLAARGYAPDPNGDPSLHDCVFVRDLVLPVRIGVYARERNAPQRVRFSIDVLIARLTHATQELRDVFSYDVITDGIGMLIAAGHVDLVETLAERVAAMLLTHPRVIKVTATLEKLDVGTGIVGVTIERTRETAQAAIGDLFGMPENGS